MKILIVDDDDAFRGSLVTCLTLEGYSVIGVSSGREALMVLLDIEIDIMITDILMPGMDGVELSLNVKYEYPKLKVVGMSGGDEVISFDLIERMSKHLMTSYIRKPFEANELLEKIEVLEKPEMIS
ncbi:MAG: response regulator [Planctomycetota bacterium]|nr:MAG: response regulator [Planctomycetota bacterium]